ncbi:HET-domain-containing protein [Cadophora sp. DSE1049]|nr:HET-domain-containing protein [Cadophora sp. DSE1049]
MPASNFPYRYGQKDRNQIRLIRLFPGKTHHDICVDINRVYASSNPTYEALSYAWGDPDHIGRSRGTTISYESKFYNKGVLLISRNLASAFRHLRNLKEVRTLWIDAISINQGDIEERSEEVAKMGSIYSNAWRVIVWLGSSSEDSALALQTLSNIQEDIDFVERDGNHTFTASGATRELERSPSAWRTKVLSWIAIRNLLNRPWFGRLWIFQEIGNAANAVVVVGKDAMPWETLRVAVFWILHMTEGKAPLCDVFDAAYLRQIEPLMKENRGRALERLLDSTKKSLCSNPRDRIYAVLSLLHKHDPIAEAIIPDYSRSVEEVYTKLTLSQIQTSGKLRLLSLCTFRNPKSTLNLHSWVPDLSIPNLLESILNSNASGLSTHENDPGLDYHDSKKSLKIRGCVAGVINEVLTPIEPSARLP